MAIKAVLFDHDGTLVDSEPIHFLLWKQVLDRYDISLTDKQYRDHYAGVPTPANAKDIVRRFSLDESADVLIEKKNSAVHEYLQAQPFPLMPTARKTISSLHRRGLKLAVVTGASGSAAQATLQGYALQNYFSALVSGDDVKRSKPAPDCYLLALKQLEIIPSECIAIEDTEHGMKAAVGAGIPCIAIPTDMSRNHNFSDAIAVLDGLGEALNYIENHFYVASRKT